jgi:hypothetical protein
MPVTAIIPVQIDGDAPSVNCSFTQGPFVRTTGPSRIEDLGFTYAASDNCGGLPLNVTVSIYSSEIENFNAQELALFYQDGLANPQAQLYLARGICSTESNGQCIKDHKAQDARLYTAVVSATDEASNTAIAECSIAIKPNGNLQKKDANTDLSTQRFFLTSFSSVF